MYWINRFLLFFKRSFSQDSVLKFLYLFWLVKIDASRTEYVNFRILRDALLLRLLRMPMVWFNLVAVSFIYFELSELSSKRTPRCFNNLSNPHRHSANADVKSKIILSCWQFFADVIFSATSKVQNYQNKTGEEFLYSNKCVFTTYFKEF